MKNQLKKKKTLTLQDLYSSGINKYFTSSTTLPVIAGFPKLKISNERIGTGTSTATSNFTINLANYNRITLTLKDVAISSDINVVTRFGFVPANGGAYFSNVAYTKGAGSSTLEFNSGFGDKIINYFSLLNPLDITMDLNIKENYIDFIVEGSRTRMDTIENLKANSIILEICRITSNDSANKTVSYGDFILTLEEAD